MEATCSAIGALLVTDPGSPVVEAHVASCEACREARQMALVFAKVARPAAKKDVAQAFQAGQTVLHYTLVELLGSGGQGAVFKAVEQDLPDAFVAVKIVPASAASIKEARAKAINHPNVMRIHHTTLVDAYRVIEMEHVEGGTLSDRIPPVAKQPLPFKEAIAIFRGVLAGVEALHDANLLHLDLKPRNILLRGGSVPVVTDFGMSIRPGSRVLGGTNGWTAPEVLDGHEPDARADVYSLGKILDAMVDKPASALAEVIQRAESIRPDRRYPDVASLRAALDEALALDSAVLALAPTVPRESLVTTTASDTTDVTPSDAIPTTPLATQPPERSDTESVTLPMATVRVQQPRDPQRVGSRRAPWILVLAVAATIAILAGTRVLSSTTEPAAASAQPSTATPPSAAAPTASATPPPPPSEEPAASVPVPSAPAPSASATTPRRSVRKPSVPVRPPATQAPRSPYPGVL